MYFFEFYEKNNQFAKDKDQKNEINIEGRPVKEPLEFFSPRILITWKEILGGILRFCSWETFHVQGSLLGFSLLEFSSDTKRYLVEFYVSAHVKGTLNQVSTYDDDDRQSLLRSRPLISHFLLKRYNRRGNFENSERLNQNLSQQSISEESRYLEMDCGRSRDLDLRSNIEQGPSFPLQQP